MFEYDFMRSAFAASGIVAILAGLVGIFLVLRGQTFAGHALSHVGFTGATGAVLFGLSPLVGLVGFTVIAGFAMGALGERLSQRDVAIGMMLSLALGLGLLFLHFYTSYVAQAAALLFGNVLGVDNAALIALPALAVREPAAGIGRGARRQCARRLDRLPDHRRHRRRRMRPDRRRAAGFHADGRPGRRGARFHKAALCGGGARRPARPRRSLGRPDARLLQRLADELLDHGAVGRCLFRQLDRRPQKRVIPFSP